MMKKLMGVLALAVTAVAMINCSDDEPARVTIESITPIHAVPQASVTITGSNFGATADKNQVKFNGVAAEVLDADKNQLTVRVPAGATTGKVSVTAGKAKGESAEEFEVLKDVPRDQLALFYSFSGDFKDYSGNGQNLPPTNVGNESYQTDRFGKPLQALIFDGVDDDTFKGGFSLTNPLTVSCWVKYDAEDGGGMIGSSAGALKGFIMALYPSLLVIEVDDNVVYQIENVIPATSNGAWISLAVTFGQNDLKVYVNGVLKKSYTASSKVSATNFFRLGQLPGGNPIYSGGLDDIIIYRKILTETEVMMLHNQTVTKYPAAED